MDDSNRVVRSSHAQEPEEPSRDEPITSVSRLERQSRLRPVEPARAHLVVVMGGEPGRRYIIEERAVLGRGRIASIRIRSNQVSRCHAQITRTEDGDFLLEDLGSRNGTLVNDMRVHEHVLQTGDTIQLGADTVLRFAHADPLEDHVARFQRMEVLGKLVAGVAHEFNNLLAIVLASLNYVTTSPADATLGDPQVADPLNDATAAAERATDLTRQLLGLARPEERTADVVDITELVHDVARLIRRTVQREIAVDLRVEPSLRVKGSRGRLHQALMNLAINARDAMLSGGTLELCARRVAAHELKPAPGLASVPHIQIAVVDDGVGMGPETRERAFDPFFTTKGSGSGTGLGLSLVYKTIQDHSGHVECETAAGAGTTFRIYLPELDPAEELQADRRTTLPDCPERLQGQILLVDDEAMLLRSTERILRRSGFDVLCALSGREALALYEQERDNVSLIMLDIRMPGLNGEETLHRLRQIDSSCKVVVVSGHCNEPLARRLVQRGAIDVMHKPWSPRELLDCIRRALGGLEQCA